MKNLGLTITMAAVGVLAAATLADNSDGQVALSASANLSSPRVLAGAARRKFVQVESVAGVEGDDVSSGCRGATDAR